MRRSVARAFLMCLVLASALDACAQFFSAPELYPAGPNPSYVAVGDFNADGRPDVVVADLVTIGQCSVLLQLPDGTFGAPITLFTGGRLCGAVAVADLNGDHVQDIIATSSYMTVSMPNDGAISIFTGDGSGGFSAPHVIPIGQVVRGVAVADMNGDQRPDVLVADGISGSSAISILLSEPGGNLVLLGRYPAGPQNINDLHVADLDLDGKPDVLTTLPFAHQLTLLRNMGNGALASPITSFAASDGFGCTTGLFEADWHPVCAAPGGGAEIQFFRSSSAGLLNYLSMDCPGINRWVDTGDFDRDGALDVVSVEVGGRLILLRGKGDGMFFSAMSSPDIGLGNFRTVDVADFNGDGRLDVVAGATTQGKIVIYKNEMPPSAQYVLDARLDLRDLDPASPLASPQVTYSVMSGDNSLFSETVLVSPDGLVRTHIPGSIQGSHDLVFDSLTNLKRTVAVSFPPAGSYLGVIALSNGDADQSGEVDAADIDVVISLFGGEYGEAGYAESADLDRSGDIDAADIDIAIANFGSTDM